MNASTMIEAFNLGLKSGRAEERQLIIAYLEEVSRHPSQVNLEGAIRLLKRDEEE